MLPQKLPNSVTFLWPHVGPGICKIGPGPALFSCQRSYEATKPGLVFVFILCHSIFVFLMTVCFCCVGFSFFSTSQEIGWEERLQNDLFCVKWDAKP